MILTLELYIQLGYYLKNGDWIGHVKEITL